VTTALLILLLAIATMGSRLIGTLSGRMPGGRLERILHYVPFGLFAALVVIGTPTAPEPHWLAWLSGMAATGILAYRGTSIFLSLVAGIGLAFLVSQLLT